MPSFQYIENTIKPGESWIVQWQIDGIEMSHTIDVERSDGQEGPWETVAKDLSWDTVSYEDTDVTNRSFWHTRFYRVIVKDSQGNEILKSRGQTFDTGQNRIIGEMIREKDLILYGANSHPGFFSREFSCHKPTTQGTLCHHCVDQETEEVYLDECPVCKGTRYTEAYAKPITFKALWMDKDRRRTIQSTRGGKVESEDKRLYTSNYPILEPEDVLTEKRSGDHWKVKMIDATKPNDIVVEQIAEVELIPRDFVESQLNFPE